MRLKNNSLLRYAAAAALVTTGLVGVTAGPAAADAQCNHSNHTHWHFSAFHTDHWQWLSSAGSYPNVSETFENVTHHYFETRSGCIYMTPQP
jgi:hypothetical protein